jgi:cytochrome c-type biogenesis protein CcmH/NrfG
MRAIRLASIHAPGYAVVVRWVRLLMIVALGGGVVGGSVVGCGGDEGKKVRRPRGKGGGDLSAKELLGQARSAAKKGDNDRADTLYGAAYKEEPKFSLLAEHVRFLIDTKRAGKAVELSKIYYDDNTGDIKGFELYAEALIAANDSTTADKVTEELIMLAEDSAGAHALRGQALLLLKGKRDEGISELRRAVELDGKDPRVLLALGEALHKVGKAEDAQVTLRSAVKADPDNPRGYVLLAAALREMKEYDEAKEFLKRAMDLAPASGAPYFELGIIHNQLTEQADAEQALAKAVELEPEDTRFWYAYGEILRLRATVDPKRIDTGKLDQAINAYKRSLDIRPPHPKAAGKLARSLLDANRHDEAEVLLTSMLRADPNNADNYYYLGAVYAHAKKYKMAIDSYERFLDLSPKDDPERDRVRKAIQDLKKRL